MSKKTRSARGDHVDFDLLAIKQQLATKPVPVGVNERRRFIDEKDGIKSKVVAPAPAALPEAFQIAVEAVRAAEVAASSDVVEGVEQNIVVSKTKSK